VHSGVIGCMRFWVLGISTGSNNYVPFGLYLFLVVSGSVLVFGSDMYLISWVVHRVSSLVMAYRRCMRKVGSRGIGCTGG